MDTLQGLLDRLDAKKKETQADIKQTATDISSTEDAMAEALSNRSSVGVDFKAALKDDIDTVALIASAIDAMTASYQNYKLPLGLLSRRRHLRLRPTRTPPSRGARTRTTPSPR